MQLYIFDRNDNLLDIITDYFNSDYNRSINKEWGFKFETSFNKHLIKNNKIGLYDRHDKFRLFEIQGVDENYDLDIYTIDCLNDYVTLGHTVIEDKRVVGGNCRSALEKVLEGTNYKIGKVEPVLLENINFYFCTRLKGLNDILNTYKCELDTRIEIGEDGVIKAKYIDLLYAVGQETNIRCTYDTNLTSFKRVPLDGHCTVIYGRGKSLETENGGFSRKLTFEDVVWVSPDNPTNKPYGVKYLEDTEAIEKYGRIEGLFEDDKIEDPAVLIEKSWIALQNAKIPKYSYEGSIKDLEQLEEFKHYKIEIGDTIAIINEDKDLAIQSRLIQESYTLDPDEEIDVKITLGNFTPSLTSDETDVKAEIDKAIGNIDIDLEIKDESYPNTLPSIPVVTGVGGLDSIGITWTYESKNYYNYEVYASKVKGFNPTFTHLAFKGQASRYLHECKPKETWYFKVRAINTYGQTTEFSNELEVSTTKIQDGATYFENGVISDALIGTLRADRAWFGKIQAQYINLLEIKVGDENNPTFHIDSYAKLYGNFQELSINSESVDTSTQVTNKVNAAKTELNRTISTVNDNVTNVKDVLLPSLEDGVLNESERNSIESNLKPLQSSFIQISKEYNILHSNSNLTGAYKTNLKNAYDAYKLKYDGLIKIIDNILILDKITNENIIAFNTAYEHHNNQLEIYTQRSNEAFDSITSNKSNTVYTNSKNYTNAEIKLVNDKIELKASKSQVNEVSNIATSANNKIDNLKIVNRNLLLGSNIPMTNSDYLVKEFNFIDLVKPSRQYTVVLNGEIAEGQQFGVWFNGGNAGGFRVDRVEGVHTYVIKVTTPPSFTRDRIAIFNFPNASNSKQATINWCCMYEGHNKVPLDCILSNEDLQKYAEDVAVAKARLAKEEAIANADGKITAEEKARIAEAKKNLDTALAKVDNLQIGSRNLLFNSGDFKDLEGWVLNGGTTLEIVEKDSTKVIHAYGSIRQPRILKIEPNSEYMYSCEIMFETDTVLPGVVVPLHFHVLKDETGETGYGAYSCTPSVPISYPFTVKANTWFRISYKFAMGADANYFRTYIYGDLVNQNYWLKNIQLTKGNKLSDWLAAPEDTQKQIDDVGTSIKETKEQVGDVLIKYNEVTSSVKDLETKEVRNRKVTSFRYIRDYLNGSTSNGGNHTNEIQVWASGTNIALGKTPTSSISISDPQKCTDGVIDNSYTSFGSDVWCYLQLDLGAVITNIDMVKIWHYFDDNRAYNHKLAVSSDGVNWTYLFDSEVQGTYQETSQGRTYIINESFTEARLKIAEEKITSDAIVNTVKQSVDSNGQKTFVTGTEFAQTKDDFQFKFENNGKPNELVNSDFSQITRGWTMQASSADCFVEYSTGYSGTEVVGCYSLYMGLYNDGGSCFAKQTFKPRNPRMLNFTVGGVYHYDNVNVTSENPYPMAYIYIVIINKDGTEEYYNQDRVMRENNYISWVTHQQTFGRSGKEIERVEFYVWKRSTNGKFRITNLDFHEGTEHRKWLPGGEIYSNTMLIDGEGWEVRHKDGSKSKATHECFEFLNSHGNRSLRFKDGGMNLFTEVPSEMVGYVKPAMLTGTDLNGVNISTYYEGDFVCLGHSSSNDEGSWETYPQIMLSKWGGGGYNQGTNFVGDPIHVRTRMHLKNTLDVDPNAKVEFYSNSATPHQFFNSTSNDMCVMADNKLVLGFREGAANKTVLEIVETQWERIQNWHNWNFHHWTMHNMKLATRLNAQSPQLKSKTKNINEVYAPRSMTDGEIRYTCRETQVINSLGVDLKSRTISSGQDRTLVVELPQILAENMELDYHVNISKLSWGDYRIIEKTQYYFIIESNVDDFQFTYEVVGKQLFEDHANVRIASEQYRTIDTPEENEQEKISFVDDPRVKKKQYWELYKK